MAAMAIPCKGIVMNSQVINYLYTKTFQRRLPRSLCEMIFADLLELLKFLGRAESENLLPGGFFFSDNIDYLDQCWHDFILHTRLYSDFCTKHVGYFVHHTPGATGEPEICDLAHALEKQLQVLEENLGPAFVQRIYFIYPELVKAHADAI